ncbi:MAG TPA: 4-alpha-glucanotransferase, partial [Porphyromonadaceae bacterium]|nr:4-alpha-glucanotransferase [Porphyromonadaceae bacterium]
MISFCGKFYYLREDYIKGNKMKITLRINYHTYGRAERLYFCPEICTKFFGEDQDAFPMEEEGEGNWVFSKESMQYLSHLQYSFEVRDWEGRTLRKEWGHPHALSIYGNPNEVEIQTCWHDIPLSLPFESAPFAQMLFKREGNAKQEYPKSNRYVLLRILSPFVKPEETLVICGEGETLGSWDTKNAPVMQEKHFPVWEIMLPMERLKNGEQYKFVVVNRQTKEPIYWEEGENRCLDLEHSKECDAVCVMGMQFRRSSYDWKGAGVAIPVFSLRSKQSAGIGDFADLLPLVDWAKECGMCIIQMLPINDTTMDHTWSDSYPYRSTSVFALNPMYLSMENMGCLKDEQKMKNYRLEWERLNELPELDYEAVDCSKWNYFRELYDEQHSSLWKDSDFRTFIERNKYWLKPYAVYSFLRDKHHTPNFHTWGKESIYSKELVENYFPSKREVRKELGIYVFLQYHLYKQLSQAREYAHSKGIIFKGDLPIGIGRESVEAWMNPELFHMDCQAGAPPDMFSKTGQNWGFPTYNWERMFKDGLSWWKGRFAMMKECFDAFRIDHILGFFRIWEIPCHSIEGLLGYFSPALPYTKEDILSFGFSFEEKHTKPRITEELLRKIFGNDANSVKKIYLNIQPDGETYSLKVDYSTQHSIENAFRYSKEEHSQKIKKGLFALCNEVLFVPDPYKKDCYHPRIGALES